VIDVCLLSNRPKHYPELGHKVWSVCYLAKKGGLQPIFGQKNGVLWWEITGFGGHVCLCKEGGEGLADLNSVFRPNVYNFFCTDPLPFNILLLLHQFTPEPPCFTGRLPIGIPPGLISMTTGWTLNVGDCQRRPKLTKALIFLPVPENGIIHHMVLVYHWPVDHCNPPSVAPVARDVLAIPGVSVSVERLFSSMKNTLMDHRSSLTAEMASMYKGATQIRSGKRCRLWAVA